MVIWAIEAGDLWDCLDFFPSAGSEIEAPLTDMLFIYFFSPENLSLYTGMENWCSESLCSAFYRTQKLI